MDSVRHTLPVQVPDTLIRARVDGRRTLVITWKGDKAREVFQGLVDKNPDVTIKRSASDLAADADGSSPEDGPNHRGTYSKAYVEKHPEIRWMHRGQGRYLPASHAKTLETVFTST